MIILNGKGHLKQVAFSERGEIYENVL